MNCRACGGTTEIVFEMAPMPLAGAFTVTRAEALNATKYPLSWEWCRVCGLVNVAPDIPDATLYADYSYRASDVPALVRHHRAFALWLARRYGEDIAHLEIGGNDGVLLRQLPTSWRSVNVDPSDAARGPEVIHQPWPVDLGRQFDVITSSNAFAHFSALGAGLDAVRAALKPGGQFVVEVHDLDATLRLGQWDTVYHEHKVEWSRDALYRAGAIHGLQLVRVHDLPLHGGLLRAVFVKYKPEPVAPAIRPDFDGLARAYRNRTAPRLPKGSAAYGAAARATVYLNQVRPRVDYVVDGSPRRAGRYVPGTGTPIVTPDYFDADCPPACLITAWNHAADIKARHPDYQDWVSAWH